MPPRLNRRQQRELEELEALNSAKPTSSLDEISEDEDIPGPSQRRGGGTFSNFLAPEDSEEDEAEQEEEKAPKSRKSKKKKKKPTEGAAVDAPTSKEPAKTTRTSTPVPPVRNEKKALKKARAKEKKAANDELDQVLAELSIQYPASQKISQATTGKQSLADLLSVSLQHLDGEAEMRRFFGSRVVTANRTEQSSSRKKVPAVKSHLTRPQPTWWAAKGREGLSLRPLSDEETEAKLKRHGWTPMQEKWWTVEYSKKYKSMTKAFMDTVLSGDPQGFWDLLGTLPWHADTLLQISEVYRHREEHAQAVDFIDRALFTYERSFIGSFNFTTGLNRLDFDHVENRPFFLALHRQVTDLQRRGCVRTAFEFSRLMYSIDPWNDPHGALLHLDFLAIKAGMQQWLVDVYDIFAERRASGSVGQDTRLNPSVLPGWAYARALALRVSEDATKEKDHTKSTNALKEALHDFPSVVPLLADKLDVSLPANIRAHRDFKIETDAYSLSPPVGTLHLLSHLYVQRSLPLWKEHATWFRSTTTEAFSTLPSSLPVTERRKSFFFQFENQNLRYSVYRHIMVLETSYRRLFSFIPRQVLEAKSLACDPLPPPTSINEYDAQFFHSVDDLYSPRVRSRRQRANDERRLAQFIPDAAFRQQLQAFFDAHPHFAERFPGGILQFAQMAGQLPPDVLEDLMLVEAVNGAPGAMPGGLDNMQDDNDDNLVEVDFIPAPVQAAPAPAQQRQQAVAEADSEEEEEEEDDQEEEEYISASYFLLPRTRGPMPRVLRNILGRFWGRNAQAEESSSEDEAPLDNTGVD
ncbi:transcriptional repressor TCF25-domain-containing protein [Flammula alnicola]|nr:transcriptional repressor TCF25-domain-containing protein [Flammula alnicola]